jgi:hypothetical protein
VTARALPGALDHGRFPCTSRGSPVVMDAIPVHDDRQARNLNRRSGSFLLVEWTATEAASRRSSPPLTITDVAADGYGGEPRPPRLVSSATGFGDIEVAGRPGWRATERAMWEEAAALDPGDDPALRSFHDEGVRSLEIFSLVSRVIATATAPQAGPTSAPPLQDATGLTEDCRARSRRSARQSPSAEKPRMPRRAG